MSDVVERAEEWLKTQPYRPAAGIVGGLLDALKAARAENDRLRHDNRMAP